MIVKKTNYFNCSFNYGWPFGHADPVNALSGDFSYFISRKYNCPSLHKFIQKSSPTYSLILPVDGVVKVYMYIH